MTKIVDYTSLQTAVTEYLARNQDSTLIARIPTFIQLAEAKFNRQLFVRQMEQRATALVNLSSSEPEFISLPSDFQSMRRVRLSSVSGKPGWNSSPARRSTSTGSRRPTSPAGRDTSLCSVTSSKSLPRRMRPTRSRWYIGGIFRRLRPTIRTGCWLLRRTFTFTAHCWNQRLTSRKTVASRPGGLDSPRP